MDKKALIGIIIAVIVVIGLIIFLAAKSSNVETPTNEQENLPPLDQNTQIEENPVEEVPEEVPEQTGPQTHEVEMLDFEFSPQDITIKKGDTVTWTNKGKGPHYVMTSSGKRLLDSKTIPTDESWSYTFEDLGSHKYFSPIYSAMTGTVTVEE